MSTDANSKSTISAPIPLRPELEQGLNNLGLSLDAISAVKSSKDPEKAAQTAIAALTLANGLTDFFLKGGLGATFKDGLGMSIKPVIIELSVMAVIINSVEGNYEMIPSNILTAVSAAFGAVGNYANQVPVLGLPLSKVLFGIEAGIGFAATASANGRDINYYIDYYRNYFELKDLPDWVTKILDSDIEGDMKEMQGAQDELSKESYKLMEEFDNIIKSIEYYEERKKDLLEKLKAQGINPLDLSREELDQLMRDPTYCNAPPIDPLILDLNGNGISTIGSTGKDGAMFDFNNDGLRTASGWVAPTDGLLVWDRNNDGSINSGL